MPRTSSLVVMTVLGLALAGCGGSGATAIQTPALTADFTGNVWKAEGGIPVVGATVEAWNPKDGPYTPGWDAENHGVLTDAHGNFDLKVPPGTYYLEVSTAGRVWLATAGPYTIKDGDQLYKSIAVASP